MGRAPLHATLRCGAASTPPPPLHSPRIDCHPPGARRAPQGHVPAPTCPMSPLHVSSEFTSTRVWSGCSGRPPNLCVRMPRPAARGLRVGGMLLGRQETMPARVHKARCLPGTSKQRPQLPHSLSGAQACKRLECGVAHVGHQGGVALGLQGPAAHPVLGRLQHAHKLGRVPARRAPRPQQPRSGVGRAARG